MIWLADIILIVHVAFVAFVVGGFVFVLAGASRRWKAVRNYRFRVLHLAAIGVVMVETLIGMACPLTAWEDRLRGQMYESGFVIRSLHKILFYDFPGWVFTLVYTLFALAVALAFILIPPHRKR